MNPRKLEYLRAQKEALRKLRKALDDLPPVGWAALARACAHERHSLEELYEWLDGLDERLDKALLNAARKNAP